MISAKEARALSDSKRTIFNYCGLESLYYSIANMAGHSATSLLLTVGPAYDLDVLCGSLNDNGFEYDFIEPSMCRISW